MKSSAFCPVPWINLSVDVNGSVRPCCKFVQPTEAGAVNLGNLNERPLSDIWNSKEMRDLRQEFLDGKKPDGCKACWEEEASGVISFRQNFVQGRVDETLIPMLESSESAGPLVLDLKLSQKCNFKCRICGPIASSTFMAEEEKINPHFKISSEEKRYLTANKIFGKESELSWLKDNLSRLQFIELYGGEPLLGKENRILENFLIDQGYSKNISLHYNTNASLFDPHLVKNWTYFKSVSICFSIDDIGKRFEYQRFPGKWHNIEANLKRYREIRTESMRYTMFCSVSVFNVFHLHEFAEWACRQFPDVPLMFNIVHSEPMFNISFLPERLKQRALESLNKIVHGSFPLEIVDQAKGLIDFMFSRSEEKHFPLLKSEITKRDKVRGQNFSEVYEDIAPLFS